MPPEEELNKDSIFTSEIEYNGNICDNCYRRLKYKYEPHPKANAATHDVEYQDSARFGYFGDEQETGRPSIKKSYCKCGSVDSGAKIRPFDVGEMMEVASRVSDRLEELEIEYNEDVFFSVVKEKKKSPEHQFNEEIILEEATERSVDIES